MQRGMAGGTLAGGEGAAGVTPEERTASGHAAASELHQERAPEGTATSSQTAERRSSMEDSSSQPALTASRSKKSWVMSFISPFAQMADGPESPFAGAAHSPALSSLHLHLGFGNLQNSLQLCTAIKSQSFSPLRFPFFIPHLFVFLFFFFFFFLFCLESSSSVIIDELRAMPLSARAPALQRVSCAG